jgi:macrolide transport system ATP-binding/permease protein
MTPPLIELKDVTRYYGSGDTEVRALDGVSLTIETGEFVAIVGQSGSGKSTLMNMLGCLDRPTTGVYSIRGQNVSDLDPDGLAALRRQTFGFIFQRYNLLASVTASENVEIPAVYAGLKISERREKAASLLAKLGLGERVANSSVWPSLARWSMMRKSFWRMSPPALWIQAPAMIF